MMTLIDKQTAARYMIHCAIRNTLNGECPVSNHVIILSAREILFDLAKTRGVTLASDLGNLVKDEHRAEFRRRMKERYNFLKHADEDHDHELDITNIQFSNDGELLMVIAHYRELFGEQTAHMRSYASFALMVFREAFSVDDVELNPERRETTRELVNFLATATRRELCEALADGLIRSLEVSHEFADARELNFRERVARTVVGDERYSKRK